MPIIDLVPRNNDDDQADHLPDEKKQPRRSRRTKMEFDELSTGIIVV
jgi:hypothetical protein